MGKNNPSKTKQDVQTDKVEEETAGVTVTETQKVEETPPVVTAPVVATQQKATNLSKDLAGINSPKDKIAYKLREYMDMMALNRQQTPESMAIGALKLAEIINDTLRVPAELYQANMTAVIETIRANRSGVFHDKCVYRGFLAIHGRLGVARAELITEVLSVILTVADSKSLTDAMKRTTPAIVAERFTDQEQADKFVGYFTRGQ